MYYSFSIIYNTCNAVLHRPKRKMRHTFYKKIKNYQQVWDYKGVSPLGAESTSSLKGSLFIYAFSKNQPMI